MSRRIAVCVLSLALAGTVLAPSSSFAQSAPDDRAAIGGLGWLSELWDQALDKFALLSDTGLVIDGNGLASVSSQTGLVIDGNGASSDTGLVIDGNGRTAPRSDD